jgi:uncharacterized delta-60 repeat protein
MRNSPPNMGLGVSRGAYRMASMRAVVHWSIMALLGSWLHGADGDPTPGFGTSGFAPLAFSFGSGVVESIAPLADGSLVIGGFYIDSHLDFKTFVARCTADGSLDPAFGGGTGSVSTQIGDYYDLGSWVAVQPDGRILQAGTAWDTNVRNVRWTLNRYLANGVLDPSFNGTGTVVTAIGPGNSASGLLLQSDGDILVSGTTFENDAQLMLGRYLPDGTLDASFNGTGIVYYQPAGANMAVVSVVQQADGGYLILAADHNASGAMVLRFRHDGTLDAGFAMQGIARVDHAFDYTNPVNMAVMADGRILITGSGASAPDYHYLFFMDRLMPDGGVDHSFGTDGTVIDTFGPAGVNAYVGSTQVQADGKVMMMGEWWDPSGAPPNHTVFRRYLPDGSLDRAFATDGELRNMATGGNQLLCSAIGPSRRLLMGGSSFLSSLVIGTQSLTLTPDGIASNADPISFTLASSIALPGLSAADFDVTGGRVLGVVAGQSAYTIAVSPAADGLVSLALPAGSFVDAFGSPTPALSATVTSDRTPPQPVITGPAGPVVLANVVQIEISFGETVVGLSPADVAVVNGSLQDVVASADGFTASLVPSGIGVTTVLVPAGICHDLAGNAASSTTYAIDIQDPLGPTTMLASPVLDHRNVVLIPVTVTFSAPVSGFDTQDLSVTGGAVDSLAGDGTTYTALIRPDADTIIVGVPSRAATDAGGHGNRAAASLQITYHPGGVTGHHCGSGSGIASLTLGLLAMALLLLARRDVRRTTAL